LQQQQMFTCTQTHTIYLTQSPQPPGINIYIQSKSNFVSLK